MKHLSFILLGNLLSKQLKLQDIYTLKDLARAA